MAGRLLLVGELSDDLTDLRITFEAAGLSVEMAPDGMTGLEKGREFQPDLVVTEILINRLSGFELASRIGSGDAGFVAPVIFYTEFYRDEKARREVLGKYGAVQYFVRPFQKDALKKSVVAHFQDYLSSLADVVAVESAPEPASSVPEVSPIVPQLSRAAAAAEKRPGGPVSGRPVQSGRLDTPGAPAPYHVSSSSDQRAASEVDNAEPKATGTVTDRSESPPLDTAARAQAERGPEPDRASEYSQRRLLLPVKEFSWFERCLQSIPFRIAAVVLVAALALYLVRHGLQGKREELSSQGPEAAAVAQTGTSAEPMSAPPAGAASPAAMGGSEILPAEREQAEVNSGSSVGLSSPSVRDQSTPSVKTKAPADSRVADRKATPSLSIQDVTGSGRGPVLRRMKPIQLSPGVLNQLSAKAIVVRIVVDNGGKVTEVTPVNQEGAAASLPADALAAIHQWEFSRSRRKAGGEAVKYFSLKAQNPRQ